jgi:hypothetical protein
MRIAFLDPAHRVGCAACARDADTRPRFEAAAVRVLEERYARGEITREDFLECPRRAPWELPRRRRRRLAVESMAAKNPEQLAPTELKEPLGSSRRGGPKPVGSGR